MKTFCFLFSLISFSPLLFSAPCCEPQCSSVSLEETSPSSSSSLKKEEKPVSAQEINKASASKEEVETSPSSNESSGGEGAKVPAYLAKPLKVGVMLIVKELVDVSEKSGNFEAKIELRLRWRDPSLAFDRKVVGTTRLEYDGVQTPIKLKEIWNPEILIANMEPNPNRIEPSMFITEDGEVDYIRRIDGKFHTDFHLSSFPFDSQNLPITLLSKFYNKGELAFEQNSEEMSRSKISKAVSLSGWKIRGMKWTTDSIRGWDGNYYPEISASIELSRDPFGHLVVLIPLLLIMILPSYITLYLPEVEMIYRLEAWAGSILTLVATSFTLNLKYPTLEPDSIVNRLFLIFFVFQFLMIVLTVTLFNQKFTKFHKNQNFIEELKNFCRWSIPVGFFLVVIVNALLVIYSGEANG